MKKDISILFGYRYQFNFKYKGQVYSGYAMFFIFLKKGLHDSLHESVFNHIEN